MVGNRSEAVCNSMLAMTRAGNGSSVINFVREDYCSFSNIIYSVIFGSSRGVGGGGLIIEMGVF